MGLRVGVASIVQETNTFSPLRSTLDDFTSQGLLLGNDVESLAGANTEAAGALAALTEHGAVAVPLMRAWAMSGGSIDRKALGELASLLRRELAAVDELDGLVLSLHGALVDEVGASGDLTLLRAARSVLGNVPIGVCLDLHANVSDALVRESSFVVGYKTYPHVDQAQTGARAAELMLDLLAGRASPCTRLAKIPLLTPPEGQGPDGPLGALRGTADARTRDGVLDVSLFPVQPWLDVADLGFGVTVTTDGDPARAESLAGEIATAAWDLRELFDVELVEPVTALARARRTSRRPVLLSESADSPTAGAAADSPAAIRALLEHGAGLRAYATVVDPDGVDRLTEAGVASGLTIELGCRLDSRFHRPVEVSGEVAAVGDGSFALTGPVFTGMKVSMGRWARLDHDGLSVLVTERPACTFDPECYRQAGLRPEDADVIVIRSANLFRAGWGAAADGAMILDLPGASTPRFDRLDYRRIPRPMYPLDR